MRVRKLIKEDTVRIRDSELSAIITPTLKKLSKVYENAGHELRVVGGAVRDLIAGKKPKDIDLSSTATPQESIAIAENIDARVIPTGLQHGTITIIYDGEEFEITTLRIDVDTDGRHADVEFTTDWREDAARRDLTFNAMSMDMAGNVYDYFGGIHDLKSGIARFVGNAEERVNEDYLRILRYFRFLGRVENPSPDTDTLRKIEHNADGLRNISGERIWMEMSKILSGNHVGDILEAMKHTGVLEVIGLEAPAIGQAVRVRKNTNKPEIVLAALANNVDEFASLANSWRMSNKEQKTGTFILMHRGMPINLQISKMYVAVEGVDCNLLVSLLLYKGSVHDAKRLAMWDKPKFPINGNDLIQAGMFPGPQMGEVIKKLKLAWAQSNFELQKEDLFALIFDSNKTNQ